MIRTCERNSSDICLRLNTCRVNAHNCLPTTYSLSPLVLCSSIPNSYLPSQIFRLITDLINSQHFFVSCNVLLFFTSQLFKCSVITENNNDDNDDNNDNNNNNKNDKNPLKTPRQTAIFIIILLSFFLPSYLLGFQPNVKCLLYFGYINFQYLKKKSNTNVPKKLSNIQNSLSFTEKQIYERAIFSCKCYNLPFHAFQIT